MRRGELFILYAAEIKQQSCWLMSDREIEPAKICLFEMCLNACKSDYLSSNLRFGPIQVMHYATAPATMTSFQPVNQHLFFSTCMSSVVFCLLGSHGQWKIDYWLVFAFLVAYSKCLYVWLFQVLILMTCIFFCFRFSLPITDQKRPRCLDNCESSIADLMWRVPSTQLEHQYKVCHK